MHWRKIQYLGQGYFDIKAEIAVESSIDLQTARQPTEPQPSYALTLGWGKFAVMSTPGKIVSLC